MNWSNKSYVTRKAVKLAKTLLGGKRASLFVPQPSDTFIVSYPKSGNTWIRIVLARLLSGNPELSLSGMDTIIPNVDGKLISNPKALPAPRIFKSHMPFNGDFKKVVYLTRDPRDVFVSYYHHQVRNHEFTGSLEKFSERFLSRDQPFRNWAENVGSWMNQRMGSDGFLWIRYEDLVLQPEETLWSVLKLVGLDTSIEEARSVLEKSTLGELRRTEDMDTGWKGSSGTEKGTTFFRKGGSHWKEDVENRDIYNKIESAFRPVMETCGYGGESSDR